MIKPQNKISWLFNQPEAIQAVRLLGSHSLTMVQAILHKDGEWINQGVAWAEMSLYSEATANKKLIEWMNKKIEASKEPITYYKGIRLKSNSYLYFQFVKE